MPTAIVTGFDPTEHQATGNGWVNTYDDGTGGKVTTKFATLTLAQAAAKTVFSDDYTIHNTLYAESSAAYIVTNQSAVNTATTTNRTNEGLDAAFPP